MRVSSHLAARFGAAVAAAAIAVTGAATAANAAAAPAKVTTALSISNTTPKAHRHQTTAIVKGQLTAVSTQTSPVRGAWVLLQRQGPKGHWFAVKAERTGRHGFVAFRVHLRKSAVSFRLLFRGNRNFAKSVSAVDTISPATAS
ncbi:MAG: hypothetical protein ACLQFR_11250 [Streptosporangiaceae bacterium]